MKISIVGGGPVGLLLSCLLNHEITIYEKRSQPIRNHLLNLDVDVIEKIIAVTDNIPLITYLQEIKNGPINTCDLEINLREITNAKIEEIEIKDLNDIPDSIVIGADGANSFIRKAVFDNKLVDVIENNYMVQIKFETSGSTRPRKEISALAYSSLNGLNGEDMVLDFESLQRSNDSNFKSGTLHIPIQKNVYDILTKDGRGKYNSAWTVEELAQIPNNKISKLVGIIERYNFSLKWRGGKLNNARITVLPLTTYRSKNVYKLTDKLYMLVGDASSGLVYQRGLNKGFLEAVECFKVLNNLNGFNGLFQLEAYEMFCKQLYLSEIEEIQAKTQKIKSYNKSISLTTQLVVSISIISLLALSVGFAVKAIN